MLTFLYFFLFQPNYRAQIVTADETDNPYTYLAIIIVVSSLMIGIFGRSILMEY